MTATLACITFDCADALATATFWAAALGRDLDPDASADFASIGMRGVDGPAWLFARVPEGKAAKNRVHVDLRAPDRDAEVARLVGLGATHVRDVEEWGFAWTVLTDAEGNEFCLAGPHQ